jgi:DNA invertase Pin-like site-specific DNA recombinase
MTKSESDTGISSSRRGPENLVNQGSVVCPLTRSPNAMSEHPYIAYYRVSTDQQGRSGLGLDAQRASVHQFVSTRGGSVIAEFTEVESGRKSDRPQLVFALAECRRRKMTLVIARLDRLARNVAFIARLMDTGVPFLAVDMPTADRFMLHVYSAMAEEEARRTSDRTKAALAAAKARGVVLGRNCTTLVERHIEQANEFAAKLAPTIADLRLRGFSTVRALATEMNRQGIPTAKGGRWHVPTVHYLLKRIEVVGEVA